MAKRPPASPTAVATPQAPAGLIRPAIERALILSASAGAGHLSAAKALERAFAVTGAAREVRNIDALDYTSPLLRNIYSKAYLDMVNTMPEVVGWLYDHLDKPWKPPGGKLALDKLNMRPFIRLIEQYQPDVAVCTHSLPAAILSWLKARGRIATRQAIVITDFDVHALWLCSHYEHYFVALDETAAHLVELGVPADKVSVTGIPIDPAFSEPKDRLAARAKLGLDSDRATILLSAGGFGVGNKIENLITALLKLRHPAQIVAICGRNAALKAKLDRLASGLGPGLKATLLPLGFTSAMDDYMAAADLIVGKPGGLTTSEALARGLVFVVVNPIPGQEERNSDHLLEEGAAIRCNNLPVLAYKIDRLLDDPGRLAALRSNALRLARPRAAFDVVERLARMA